VVSLRRVHGELRVSGLSVGTSTSYSTEPLLRDLERRGGRLVEGYASYDYRHLEQFRAVNEANATGAYATQFENDYDSVSALIRQGHGTASAHTIGVGVIDINGATVHELVFFDETVTNNKIPNGSLRRYRTAITLQKLPDGYRLADLKPI
jgi:hypothetical protein